MRKIVLGVFFICSQLTTSLSQSTDSTGLIDWLRANNKLLREDFSGAIKVYTEAIKIETLHPIEGNQRLLKLYLGRGAAYFKIKKFYKAIKDYTSAIELDSNNEIAYLSRGTSYLQRDNQESQVLAINDFKRATELYPAHSEAFFRLGIAEMVGSREQALVDLNQAAELGNQDAKDELKRLSTSSKPGLVIILLIFLISIPLYAWGSLFYYVFGIDKLALSIKAYFIRIKEHYFVKKEESDSQGELSPYDEVFDFDGRNEPN